MSIGQEIKIKVRILEKILKKQKNANIIDITVITDTFDGRVKKKKGLSKSLSRFEQ